MATLARTTPAPRFGLSRAQRSKYLFVLAGLTPIMAIYVVLRIWPIAQTFWMSFHDYRLVGARPFTGLDNYLFLMDDQNFWNALRNTTAFAVFTVLLSVILGLLVAVALSGKIRFRSWYEAIYFIPVITPMVPVSIAWKWIYDPTYGLLNYFLGTLGIAPVGWLIYPTYALWAIVVMSVWKVVGYNMIIFLVGIRNIPQLYYEAAAIDGAGRFQQFWRITLPLLKPIILFVTVVSTINAYNVFTQVYVMTTGSQGAPGNAVRVLVFDIYENAFRYFKMGYASAEAVVLFLIILVLTLVQFRLIRSDT
ncbi:MAG: sugar ABC transporter permease [Chloroflexi bacterium]|nr:sugar ABC transporter permease [Chloroflexota bacterium]